MREWLKGIGRNFLARRGVVTNRVPVPMSVNPKACLEMSFDYVLCHYLMRQTRIPYFVQVGAFDGVSGDPLYPYTKRGLLMGCLVEPQADAFERLRNNYAGVEGVTLKRAAVSDRMAEATLYRVRPGTPGPNWLHQLASFRRDVLLKHAAEVPGLEHAIITETIPTITFEALFAELGVEPDIVVIDTEGYDYEVIKLLNVATRKPRILYYEHLHLSRADQAACVEMLIGLSYRISVSWKDTVAYLSGE